MVTSLELITTIKIIIFIVLFILFIKFFGKDIMKFFKKRLVEEEEDGKKINKKGM